MLTLSASAHAKSRRPARGWAPVDRGATGGDNADRRSLRLVVKDDLHRIESPRLVGERLSLNHFAALDGMHSDAGVMATLGGVRTPAETRDYLDRNLEHWARFGFGLWMLHDRATGAFAGRAGLRHVEILGEDLVELAYAFAAESWGRGLATEIGRTLLELGFGRIGLDEIAAFTTTGNQASRRVLEKLGFAHAHDFERAGLPHVLYRLRPGSASEARG
jgi:RimJ/RimL family protein N-acetyltransferase